VREAEIISHCRKNLPHFMVLKKVVFLLEIPNNSTRKIPKNELRAKAKELLVSVNLSNKPSHVNPQPIPPLGE
jgi:acyl-coenzyme A synthetase/AMP-(fatty) acid ligase